jgi:simple sugar transport system substrate-binding protein
MMRWSQPHIYLLVWLLILVAGCRPKGNNGSNPQEEGTPAEAKTLVIYFVGIAGPDDLFHGTIARGAMEAGKNLGAHVIYIYPDKLTLPQYIEKIEQAIAARPDGMVVMGIDKKAVDAEAKRAKELGIVLAYNPAPPVEERPVRDPEDVYVGRVGSDEYSAGRLAADGLLHAGVKGQVLCGIHHPGDGTLMTRSEGLRKRLGEHGIETDVREVPFEPGQCEEFLTSYLRAHPGVGAIVTLDSRINGAARSAKKNLAKGDDFLLVGFDLDLPTLESIKRGEMLLTIDQQQFWRGYIPVLEIVHSIRYGLVQANYFLSGPCIVDSSNVDRVLDLTRQGFR